MESGSYHLRVALDGPDLLALIADVTREIEGQNGARSESPRGLRARKPMG